MLYDWKRLLEDHKVNEFIPFKNSFVKYPVFDYSEVDINDFNHMQKMINHNIIIPITNEEIEYETEDIGDRSTNIFV